MRDTRGLMGLLGTGIAALKLNVAVLRARDEGVKRKNQHQTSAPALGKAKTADPRAETQ